MIKILAIGNSFSEDAVKFLHEFALYHGQELRVVNLFIGGCCLREHYDNLIHDREVYEYQRNGSGTDRKISIHNALKEEKWDYITFQQCSGYSGIMDSYYPYITKLKEYIEKNVPYAEILIHKTWAYEADSDHGHFDFYNRDQKRMNSMIGSCYQEVSERLKLRIIPSGDVVTSLRTLSYFNRENGGVSICRDGFHMDELYGRYALSALWFVFIFQTDISESNFVPVVIGGTPADTGIIRAINKTIMDTLKNLM